MLRKRYILLFVVQVLAVCVVASYGRVEPPVDELTRWGCPEGTVLHRGNYCLAFDGRARTPRWVLERLTARSVAGGAVRGQFHADPEIPTEFRPSPADYEGSGYDKGHMAPAADFGGQAAMDATFTCSNCVPQNSDLNRKLWVGLEGHVRSLTTGGAIVWVITCPLYSDMQVEAIGKHRVWVPYAVAKSALVFDPSGKQATRIETWIVPNSPPPAGAGIETYRASVDHLEVTAGLDLWSGLPDALETQLEADQGAKVADKPKK